MSSKRVDLMAMSIPKSIVYLAWPVVLRLSLQMIVGIVDLAMVGGIGAAAIASVGIGNNLLWFIISATTAFSVGTTALVARSIGAKDYEHAEEVARQSIAITFIVATLIGILSLIFSKWIISFMIIFMKNPDPLVIQYGTVYFQITAISFPFFFTLMVLNGVFQGAGDMKTPLKVMFIVNIVNVVFDYLLIYGVGPFPQMGVAGAAWASTGARILAFFMALHVLTTGKTGFKLNWPKQFKFDWKIISQVTNIGFPASLEQLVTNGGTMVLSMLVAGLGTPALAANQVIMRGISIANMPGFGFNMAATTLVGQNLGAEKPERAEETGYITSKLSAYFMIILGAIIFVLTKPLVLLFTNDPEVMELSILGLRIVALSLPFMGIMLSYSGALRGAGDTMWVLIITIVGVWGARLALAFLLINVLNLGFPGIWIAYAADFVVRAYMFHVRFRKGVWKTIKFQKHPGKVSTAS